MAPYIVEPDRAGGLITVRLRGLWTVATVEVYRAELIGVGMGMIDRGLQRDRIRLLLDASSFPVQTREVIAAYVEAFDDPRFAVGRVATVAGSAVFRLQARRLAGERQRVFDDEGAALAWLAEPWIDDPSPTTANVRPLHR